jgi:hypothetical protein
MSDRLDPTAAWPEVGNSVAEIVVPHLGVALPQAWALRTDDVRLLARAMRGSCPIAFELLVLRQLEGLSCRRRRCGVLIDASIMPLQACS